jgi:hypothetical protein
MDAKIQEAVDVVAAKWAYLRDMREQQIQAQARLEAITEKTMEAGARYEEAVEALARVAREYPDQPVPGPRLTPWGRWCGDCNTFHPSSVTGEEPRRVAPCAHCGQQLHHSDIYSSWFHRDGRAQCPTGGGTAVPVEPGEKPYGLYLDDEPDGE